VCFLGPELGPLAGLLVEACLLLIYIHRSPSEQVCFLGPELGPLAGLLVGPQTGSWLLEEVHICSSRTRHTDRCAGLFGLHASGRIWSRIDPAICALPGLQHVVSATPLALPRTHAAAAKTVITRLSFASLRLT